MVLTVVDRFSKFTHFIPLGHPYTAVIVARAFFEGIVRLHGIPCSIVSDRDTMFTSASSGPSFFTLLGSSCYLVSRFTPRPMDNRKWLTELL